MNSSRTNWEERAAEYGNQLRGVLFRGLPAELNAAIDRWHAWLLTDVFLPRVKQGGRILDLGCGYGRAANIINRNRNDVSVVGQDFVFEYCRLFKEVSKCSVQADASRPPFLDDTFDGIVAITSLMYLPRLDIDRVLGDLRRVLRPGGLILIVDPGSELQKLIALKGNEESPTGGHGFSRQQYRDLLLGSGFSILAQGGNVRFSIASMFQQIFRSKKMLKIASDAVQSDFRSEGYSRFALHRWILAQSPCIPPGQTE